MLDYPHAARWGELRNSWPFFRALGFDSVEPARVESPREEKVVMMRKLRIFVSLLLVTAIGVLFAGVGTSSAFEWLCNGASVTVKGNCLFRGLNETSFILQDTGAEYSIECAIEKITTEGTVGPGTEDETTTVKVSGEGKEPNCKPTAKALNLAGEEVPNRCTKVVKFTAADTPWKTALIEEKAGPVWWDLINTGNASGAGWELKCIVLGIETRDVCISGTVAESGSGEATLVLLENLNGEFVKMFYNEVALFPTQYSNCSIGSTESGLVKGEFLLFGEIGGIEVPLTIG